MGKKTKKKLAPSTRSEASSSSTLSVAPTSPSQNPALSYTLDLWENLPHHDKYRALQGVIYINSQTRDYVWRDATGETYSGTVPETINVDDLSGKLAEPAFVTSVLASIAPKSLPHLAALSDALTTEAIFELYQKERRMRQDAAAAYAKKLRDGYKPITAETAILSSSSSASSAPSSTTASSSDSDRQPRSILRAGPRDTTKRGISFSESNSMRIFGKESEASAFISQGPVPLSEPKTTPLSITVASTQPTTSSSSSSSTFVADGYDEANVFAFFDAHIATTLQDLAEPILEGNPLYEAAISYTRRRYLKAIRAQQANQEPDGQSVSTQELIVHAVNEFRMLKKPQLLCVQRMEGAYKKFPKQVQKALQYAFDAAKEGGDYEKNFKQEAYLLRQRAVAGQLGNNRRAILDALSTLEQALPERSRVPLTMADVIQELATLPIDQIASGIKRYYPSSMQRRVESHLKRYIKANLSHIINARIHQVERHLNKKGDMAATQLLIAQLTCIRDLLVYLSIKNNLNEFLKRLQREPKNTAIKLHGEALKNRSDPVCTKIIELLNIFRKNSILEQVIERAPRDLKSFIRVIRKESNSLAAAEQAIFNRLLQNQSLAVAWSNMRTLFDCYTPSEQAQFRQRLKSYLPSSAYVNALPFIKRQWYKNQLEHFTGTSLPSPDAFAAAFMLTVPMDCAPAIDQLFYNHELQNDSTPKAFERAIFIILAERLPISVVKTVMLKLFDFYDAETKQAFSTVRFPRYLRRAMTPAQRDAAQNTLVTTLQAMSDANTDSPVAIEAAVSPNLASPTRIASCEQLRCQYLTPHLSAFQTRVAVIPANLSPEERKTRERNIVADLTSPAYEWVMALKQSITSRKWSLGLWGGTRLDGVDHKISHHQKAMLKLIRENETRIAAAIVAQTQGTAISAEAPESWIAIQQQLRELAYAAENNKGIFKTRAQGTTVFYQRVQTGDAESIAQFNPETIDGPAKTSFLAFFRAAKSASQATTDVNVTLSLPAA